MVKKAAKQAGTAGKFNSATKQYAAKAKKAVAAAKLAKPSQVSGKRSSKPKAKPAVRPARSGTAKLPAEPLTHLLDALLHTMRTISQHEDELCTLLHDARRAGMVSTALLRELQGVLTALPAQEYTDDLQAVLDITA